MPRSVMKTRIAHKIDIKSKYNFSNQCFH